MKCKKARKLIPLHVGGDLPDPPPALEKHLGQCPECQKEWDALSAMRRVLAQAALGPAPLEGEAFLKKIFLRTGSVRHASAIRPFRQRMAFRAAAAAAAVAAIIIGVLVLTSPKAPSPEKARSEESAAPSVSDSSPAESVTLLTPGARVSYGLPAVALENGGQDVLFEAEIIPDPKTASAKEDFPLFETKPVPDVEVCADF
ncbi:MAG: anti-sigma factor family protein [Planctomycetota bacterium]|jgi:anti-sigma factor RsiW